MSGIPAGAGSLLGKRLGKYEILALLALGGTAEIYLARIGGAAGFEKYVVVKCLHDHLADDPEFVKMFLDEARLAAHLDHSNIVQTMELGEHENRYYMVMEFLAGLSLAMVVRRAGERLPGGRVPVPLVMNLIAQSCAGLHYAHEKAMNGKALNIVHRDISPQNLVVSFEGVVKVVDFGIAKAELRETQTRSGTIKGKFAYMSPEQCVAANVDRRTDIFALGVIAHELLTGKRLFKKASPYETYQAVIDCQVGPPSRLNHEIDSAVDEIVMKAVAKEKENRYPTAEAFGDAILGYLHHRAKSSSPADIGRFLDTSFAQEIEEHGARMRELIANRDFAVDTGVGWGEEDEEAKRAMTRDLGARGSEQSLHTQDLERVERNSKASLSDVIDDIGEDSSDDDADEGDEGDVPAERTRIEANPLELLNALDKVPAPPKRITPQPMAAVAPPAEPAPRPATRPIPSTGRSSSASPGPSPSSTGSSTSLTTAKPEPRAPGAPPAPPIVPASLPHASALPAAMPPTGPLRLPDPPAPPPSGRLSAATPAPRVPSGCFPDLPNLPTMVAEDGKEPASHTPAAPAPSAVAVAAMNIGRSPGKMPPELARTELGALPLDSNRIAALSDTIPPPMGPPSALGPAERTGIDMASSDFGSLAVHGARATGPAPQVRPSIPSLAQGYPMMDPGMSEAMEKGASVFPGQAPGARRPPGSGGFDLNDPNRDSGQVIRPAPGAPGSGRFDANRAIDLASPVGHQYPMQSERDWATLAALPARALPPWMLALIFVGAIGVALVITIVIARLVR